nr:reverse transcriptase domain-containing protein [Tanacetum cinerariifolium]
MTELGIWKIEAFVNGYCVACKDFGANNKLAKISDDQSRTLPGNTITNPKEDLKGITTQSGVVCQGPTIPTPSKVAKQGTEVTKDQVQTLNSQSTAPVRPTVAQSESETPVSEPVVAPKLSEMARTSMNEHCLAVILNKLPRKLGDPGKFLIPCEFPGMDECLALADLGLSLPELTPTCMTLELADRSVSKPIGIAKDVSVKTGQALIDVHKGELTLRIENEAITYNLDQTSRYSANYVQMTANKIDITDEACEEYSQEVLGFSDVTASGSPTPSDDPIVSTTSPMLTPFGDSDFLLFEEADAFLGLEDDPDMKGIQVFVMGDTRMNRVCLIIDQILGLMKKERVEATEGVKENQEKDKIESKPEKNEKRGEAGKSLKQLQ